MPSAGPLPGAALSGRVELATHLCHPRRTTNRHFAPFLTDSRPRDAYSSTFTPSEGRSGQRGAAGRVSASTPPTALVAAPRTPALLRSQLMDKEVVTRTSGRRLGYVHQLTVDPARLEVAALYLRTSPTGLGAQATDHVLLYSLRQIGDVILVHDESALLDPPADEAAGYCKLVGAELVSESGVKLGKVRDYAFDPDSGAISSLKFDVLGLPSIPQALLPCSALRWEEVVAVAPQRIVVRRGAEARAVQENDGWLAEGMGMLLGILGGLGEEAEAGPGERRAGEADAYRSDPAYREWYARHGRDYSRYYGLDLPVPLEAAQRPLPRRDAAPRRAVPPQRALPAPQTPSYAEALVPGRRTAAPAAATETQGDLLEVMQQRTRPANTRGLPLRDAPPARRSALRQAQQAQRQP
ncbi:hypothetical protein ACKKBF_B05365 [Auxenochlorella protothecoides x Auxenochlorella symbiontica]